MRFGAFGELLYGPKIKVFRDSLPFVILFESVLELPLLKGFADIHSLIGSTYYIRCSGLPYINITLNEGYEPG
jgi:hypothetical protein